MEAKAVLQVAVLACGVDIVEHRQQRGHQFTGYEASQLPFRERCGS